MLIGINPFFTKSMKFFDIFFSKYASIYYYAFQADDCNN
jgi:hypothetical protein